MIFAPVDARQSAATIAAIRPASPAPAAPAHGKPILACVMADPGRPQPPRRRGERIPAYVFPENAARAPREGRRLRGLALQHTGLLWGFDDVHPEEARAICRGAVEARGEDWLTTDQKCGACSTRTVFRSAPSAVAHTADDAAALAAVLGFPFVAKILSHRVQHKTELGGVRLICRARPPSARRSTISCAGETAAGVRDAVDGVLIQPPMLSGGVEIMIGVAADRLFGR